MLKNLSIRNYALIEKLDLEFGEGLTIITGETGAGKSIMLGALSLVMGGRADTRVISDGGSKSVVAALFTDIDPDLRDELEQRGIDWIVGEDGNSELSIRRELSASGRSKIFINDTSVTLQTLSTIAPRLIDIHSQHANAKINDAAERLRIVDSLADNDAIREEYHELFTQFVALRHSISLKRDQMKQSAQNIEYIRFQLQQLETLSPKRGELTEIEKQFEILSDADDIKERLVHMTSILGDGDHGVQTLLAEATTLAEKTAGIDELANRLRLLLVEVKDIYESADDYNASIDSDPATLAKLSARMNLYYSTIKRFRVKDGDELAELYLKLKEQAAVAAGEDSELPALENRAKEMAKSLKIVADRLTESRVKAADKFSATLCDMARPLGLGNIKFVTKIGTRKLSASGQDEVEFLCSFNKNGVPKPLGEIASGGEISRMMLSLKAILAGHINLPTIIFDEVDTGVSGEIADKMGKMMHDIAENMQVIVITHLPQVAAKGDHHFKVYKHDVDTKTVTNVRQLNEEDRIRELAAMISGSELTESALSAARELLRKG